MGFDIGSQNGVDLGLVALSLPLEPVENVAGIARRQARGSALVVPHISSGQSYTPAAGV